jgi:hypothetical protein
MVAQRIQCLLKPRVLEIVKQLSEEMELTLSKTVALLVNEALEHRGHTIRPQPSVMKDIVPTDNVTQTIVTKKTEELEDSDLEMLRKLKLLKNAGLL